MICGNHNCIHSILYNMQIALHCHAHYFIAGWKANKKSKSFIEMTGYEQLVETIFLLLQSMLSFESHLFCTSLDKV